MRSQFIIDDDPMTNTLKKKNICVNKITRNRQDVNEWRTNPIIPHREILANPELFFSKFSASEIALLDAFIDLNNKFHNIFISQGRLADMAGIRRQRVNEKIGLLERSGLLSRYYRHLTTCQYRLSPYFEDPIIRERLKYIFKSLANDINRNQEVL